MTSPALSAAQWRARMDRHHADLQPWTAHLLDRRSRGKKHPVHDFLFTYYTLSPSKLLTWHPDAGEALEDDGNLPEHFAKSPYRRERGLIHRDFDPKVRKRMESVRELCAAVALRPAKHQCFGLHEWAMVHGLSTDEIRHAAWPLRMEPAALDRFVESRPLVCTHYDAYRFFTPSAAPRNSRALTPEDRLASDQSGCLHVNMDLYKWCGKMLPWIGSDLLRTAFFLAVDARTLDMRASPYDLRDLGFPPIAIETEAGRNEYEAEQRAITAKARSIRDALIRACDQLLQAS